jgi:GH15 family glucan-1,4-alpha-glucosidase
MTDPPRDAYLPIGDYGLVGNMRTAALVGKNGAVDWLCLPYFDSPSVFGAILDDAQGGRFQIAPENPDAYRSRQVYWPDSNVLITRFTGDEGAFEVVDYMPVGVHRHPGAYHRLVRRVQVLRGQVRVRMHCTPAFDYARADHALHLAGGEGAVFEGPDGAVLGLGTDWPLTVAGAGVEAVQTLAPGDRAVFTLRLMAPDERAPERLTLEAEEEICAATIAYWRQWLARCTYTGRWREAVRRSALVLKLLTFDITGAIVAAPTTSLPEAIGGARNWDYRYTWIRDAAFTLYGLLRVGFTDEVRGFIGWLQSRVEGATEGNGDGPLQIVYGVDGRRNLTEQTLDHLSGYRGSRPVRIGNAAADQLQLDIYGELVDALYLYDKYGSAISYDFWTEVVRYLDWVCENWDRPDEGIWEVRGPKQHFVYSKLMCWVALDRGLRLAGKRSLPAPHARWLAARDAIYARIMAEGWSDERQAFVQSFGADALDASNLLMPLVYFAGPNDPRVLATLDATLRPPEQGGLTHDCLVWRYNLGEVDDGVKGREEGAFNLCTFWLVEALARAGRVEPARLEMAHVLFEKMLDYRNHLGLMGEQTGLDGQVLGNFPQAFSHLGLISAAFNLDRALDAAEHPQARYADADADPSAALPPGAEPSVAPGATVPRG